MWLLVAQQVAISEAVFGAQMLDLCSYVAWAEAGRVMGPEGPCSACPAWCDQEYMATSTQTQA
jgi:hypothetical protein